MHENKPNQNVILSSEKRQENNENFVNLNDNTTKFTFKRKKNSTYKLKKEPLPMKLRALPESFWQQPNEPAQQAPGTIYPDLPEISSNDDNSLTGTTNIPNNEIDKEIVSTANTELLFSLFSVINTKESNAEKRQTALIRRGRPKKASALNKNILRDKDPCLISTVTEALLPLIPERKNNTCIEQNHQAFVTLSVSTDRAAIAPGHSYSHLLSEVVVRL